MSILVLTSDTLSSPAAAGQIEYTSPIFAATPIGTQRGIVPTQQYYRLDSAYAGSNATGAQSTFGVGVTLSSSTVYEFEALIMLSKSAGTTSHTTTPSFGGTATLNNIGYFQQTAPNTTSFATATSTNSFYVTSASGVATSGANTSASLFVMIAIRGTVSVNAGGTFIPQYTLSAAPGGAYSTAAGSFIRIAPIGASGSATNVGTWA
jgi:hypothetical protein